MASSRTTLGLRFALEQDLPSHFLTQFYVEKDCIAGTPCRIFGATVKSLS